MKELSTEEKARLYDEALKEAAIAHKDEDRHLKATLERIFPALKESRDEWTRKWLIEMVEVVRKANPTHVDYNGMCSEAKAWLEKQGEQKPAEWNEVDSMHLANAILAAEKEWGIESSTSKWLKSIKGRIKGE